MFAHLLSNMTIKSLVLNKKIYIYLTTSPTILTRVLPNVNHCRPFESSTPRSVHDQNFLIMLCLKAISNPSSSFISSSSLSFLLTLHFLVHLLQFPSTPVHLHIIHPSCLTFNITRGVSLFPTPILAPPTQLLASSTLIQFRRPLEMRGPLLSFSHVFVLRLRVAF